MKFSILKSKLSEKLQTRISGLIRRNRISIYVDRNYSREIFSSIFYLNINRQDFSDISDQQIVILYDICRLRYSTR